MSIFKRIGKIVSAEIDSRMNSNHKNQESSYSNYESAHQDTYSQKTQNKSDVNNTEAQYYANLELDPGASFEEIKKAYRTLLKKYHPDKFHGDDRAEVAEKITKKLNEAYNYFENKYKE